MPRPRALILDFNGTISDDEPLLYELIGNALRDEVGVELDQTFYEAELLGLSDPEIVERSLTHAGHEPGEDLVNRVLRAKIDAYKDEIRREQRIEPGAIDFVRTLAAEVPLAIASGAFAEEIGMAIELAGIGGAFQAVVAIDDVDHGKPSPEGYELALARINERRSLSRSIVARDVWAVEDSLAGVTAAKAAQFTCGVIVGDERAEAAADFTVDELNEETARELLAP